MSFRNFLKNKLAVKKNILKDRYNFYVLFAKSGKISLFTGVKAKKISVQELRSKKSIKTKIIKGKVANKGKAAGTVKIVIKKADLKK